MTGEKDKLRQNLRSHPAEGDSAALCRNILEHPWFRAANTVMAYAALPDEPDLTPVLETALSIGKILALPRCSLDGTMTARRISSFLQLSPGRYGIPEPGEETELLLPAEIDLLLVPGVAFDCTGGRLGRGKGCYDRFLEHGSGRTAGICYHSRLLSAVPMEAHDQRMDAVITERGSIFI